MNTVDDLFGIKNTKCDNIVIEDKCLKKNTKSTTLTQWLNSINFDKDNIMNCDNMKDYPQYIINVCLYKHRDIIYYIDAINCLTLNNKMHYEFLLNALPTKKRWAPFSKKMKNIEDVELVKKYYKVNYKRALEYFNMLDENDIINLRKIYDEGGIYKHK